MRLTTADPGDAVEQTERKTGKSGKQRSMIAEELETRPSEKEGPKHKQQETEKRPIDGRWQSE